jgi:hypothetical protein
VRVLFLGIRDGLLERQNLCDSGLKSSHNPWPVTPTLVRPNQQSGNAAKRTAPKVRDGSRRSLRKGRPPKGSAAASFQADYESARVDEIGSRAVFYKLKIKRMSGEVIDRKLLLIELCAQYTAIREIILGSKMTQGEKLDLLKQLASIPVELAPAQSESEPARSAESGATSK